MGDKYDYEVENEYEIAELNPRKNPYAKHCKKHITMGVNEDTLAYFKGLAQETGIPYQTIMNFYLDDCAKKKLKLKFA